MYLKGYKVSFPVKGIWSNGIQHRYFLDHDKAQTFLKECNKEETTSNFLFQENKMVEVAFIVIEGKHYCIGPAVNIENHQ